MIHVVSHSEAGGHARNEDAWVVQPLGDSCVGYLCALADGQGGRAGGARAAEVACRTAVEIGATYPTGKLQSSATWQKVLRAADNAVNDDADAGFATLIVFCVTPEFVSGASSGDSAAVVFGPQHYHVILTAKQHKDPPVGSGGAEPIPFFAPLKMPWTLLAMSDGVWKYAGWENILNLDPTRRVEEIVAALLARARLRGGGLQDDFTLVAFQHTLES